MTQPTNVDMTFDTSLVDLGETHPPYPSNVNTSFSTTESDPSDAGLTYTFTKQAEAENEKTPKPSQGKSPAFSPTPTASPPPKTSTPVQHIETQEAYDQWASVYDSDGNMLQSIDDDELATLLPNFLSTVVSTRSNPSLDLLDLGCGTGRNTTKLLNYDWPKDHAVSITGLDFSKGMLQVAFKKLDRVDRRGKEHVRVKLEQCDCFPTVGNKSASPMPDVQGLEPVDAVISTLVLEHIPVRDYFSTLASLVVKGGHALVTNMHSEMGRISQAGFVNAEGVKVRGKSFAYTTKETAEEAQKAGFEILQVKERKMEEWDVQAGIVGERGRKWVGIHVWYELWLRKIV